MLVREMVRFLGIESDFDGKGVGGGGGELPVGSDQEREKGRLYMCGQRRSTEGRREGIKGDQPHK